MWYQVLIPAPVLLIPILVMTTKGTQQPLKNNSIVKSDLIVTYSNHGEANDDRDEILVVTEKSIDATMTVMVSKYEYSTERAKNTVMEGSEVEEPLQDDVVFVPNKQQEVMRNDEYLQRDNLNIHDMIGEHKTVQDILAERHVRVEIESPNTDIIFVTGKNNEYAETQAKEEINKKWSYDETRSIKISDISTRSPKLDCTNLTCTNDIKSVCGSKFDNNQWKYRLFLNDCYFRKVNCNFRSVINRYKQVPVDSCKNIGHHLTQRPFSFLPAPRFKKPVQVNNTRRTSSSRRSMAMSIDGQFCSHPCPVSCPEQYEPECAVSATGRHRMFVNHCTLDLNSCSFGVVWHKRPLSECVGGKKADIRQNAGFIGWMQRVGIVDKRGRLQLS